LGGDIIYEENEDGQRVPTRRFSPDYWRNKFESYRLLKEYGSDGEPSLEKRQAENGGSAGSEEGSSQETANPEGDGAPQTENEAGNGGSNSSTRGAQMPETAAPAESRESNQHLREELKERPELLDNPTSPGRLRLRNSVVQFWTILARTFVGKLRNRTNLAITGLVSPLLALLIALVLRYSEKANYDFSSSFHIPTYIFLTLVVAMFLGLTNSADDVIRDRPALNRERNLHLPLIYYIISKVITLFAFAVVQCVVFVLIGNAILQVRGMFVEYVLFTAMTALSGIASGLLISALAPDSKTAANVIPLVLIPQIILGGALIKYEEMNTDWPFNVGLTALTDEAADTGAGFSRSKLEVPLICQFIPMRWSYEAVVVQQAKQNPLSKVQESIQADLQELTRKDELTQPELERLDVLKELLAYLYGLGGRSAAHIHRRLDQVQQAQMSGKWEDVEKLDPIRDPIYKAEQMFVNEKVTDLVSKAEIEQHDRRVERALNVFFGPRKYLFGQDISVITLNSLVLNGLTLLVLIVLYFTLRHQLRRS
jgi:ABC-type multidrug transport system permease subunit